MLFRSGNVRELEQAVRRILLTHRYITDLGTRLEREDDPAAGLISAMKEGNLNAQQLLASYCAILYERYGTYEEVARRTRLDRRTVKKYTERAGDLS